MFVVLNLNSVNMSYQCNGINGSTKITLSSNYLSEPENGRMYDCNFYLAENLKKETQLRVIRLESVIMSMWWNIGFVRCVSYRVRTPIRNIFGSIRHAERAR